MTNKQQKEIKMKKTKTKVKENNTSVFEVLGILFIIFAVADFATSWMGINLTPFMGSASRFSPIIFGLIGSALMNINKQNG
tara:strand:+ start:308 stop:550 length:243 start_codon:yes stop_codon:yes gene_type:complete